MNNVFDYFDRKVCLSFKDRPSGKPSRWPVCEKEFERVGIKNVIRFEPVIAKGPHQSFTLSQKQILTDFLNSNNKVLLTLEDDVKFLDISPLQDALVDIIRSKINWSVLYLGGNIVGDKKPVMFRRNLYKVYNVWTTHAVAYTRFAAHALLSNFPKEDEKMYDVYLGESLSCFNAFMISPIVAVQRPDYSDLWNRDVDYTGAFINSNKLLRP